MRKVAAYAFTHVSRDTAKASDCFDELGNKSSEWLGTKGASLAPLQDSELAFNLSDGREACVTAKLATTKSGRAFSIEFAEPSEASGEFRTLIQFAHKDNEVAVYCTLEAGHPTSVIAPVPFDARCPELIRTILKLNTAWSVEETLLTSGPKHARGTDGGSALALDIRDPRRSAPIIAISEESGFVVHPGIGEAMWRDVAGLANIVQIDGEAAWKLTSQLGPDWSCFNGAIRLYWPRAFESSNPFHHPLWTATRLLWGVSSTQEASRRIRSLLRRKLMAVSAFTVRRPRSCESIPRQARVEEFERQRKNASQLADFRSIVESQVEINLKLEAECKKLQEECDRLRQVVANLELVNQYSEGNDVLEPEVETPPTTVAEAVARAKGKLRSELIFGLDVDKGVQTVAADAGPPDKIYLHLLTLAEASKAKKSNSLGQDLIAWLKEKGTRASGESATILKSDDEMAKRTWNDGNSTRRFIQHTKPAEGTSPDRCVRIYFDWCKARKKICIGWIGRHPD